MKIRPRVGHPRLNRRRFLRGACGSTLALPALSLFQEQAYAQRLGVPKRLVIMFTGNGTLREEWITGGGESNFVLGPILEPLEDIRDRLLVLRGLNSDVAYEGPGDGHQTGMGCMLTGRTLLEGGEGDDSVGLASGISIDQYIAGKIGNTSVFQSLPLGVRTPGHVTSFSRMSFSGPNSPITPENDPAVVYERIANLAVDNTLDGSALERIRAKRRSAYTAVRDELRSFENYIAADDRQKLEQHLEHVASLESKLELLGGAGQTCSLPADLGERAAAVDNEMPKIGDAHMELAVHALACDLTRVVTLQWSRAVSTRTYSWLGLERNHHELSHEVDARTDSYRDIMKMDRWHAEQFGTLVRALDAREAEDGSSLLDHTAVLWVNELARGSIHTRHDQSWLLAGNLDGYFNTGRALELDGRCNNDLFVTLLHGFGIEDSTFGDPNFNEGPLTQLTA